MDRHLEMFEHGSKLMDSGNWSEAEQIFSRLLKKKENAAVRNNLAAIYHRKGDPARAWEVLSPSLQPRDGEPLRGNPFSFALATEILVALERPEEARTCLKIAVRLQDILLQEVRSLGEEGRPWREYTVAVMRGAAALPDHRAVLDLFRRWEKDHVSWENHFLAAVASFNLGRFSRAAALWGRLQEHGSFAVPLQQVAFLVERGLVPPFILKYQCTSDSFLWEEMHRQGGADEKVLARCIDDSTVRVYMLALAFDPEAEEKQVQFLIRALVRYGGEWGKEFGLNLLGASGASETMKSSAAMALVDCGVLKEGEPISIIVSGKEKQIRIQQLQVPLQHIPELDALVDQARALRETDPGAGIALLKPLYEQGNYYLPAMIGLSNLYRTVGELEPAGEILELIEELFPENPVILFSLAALCMEKGNLNRASSYLLRIPAAGLDEDFREKINILKKKIRQLRYWNVSGLMDELVDIEEEHLRDRIEKKPLPSGASLTRGLKNMPNEWLENMCAVYGLKRVRHRREREAAIAAYLVNERSLGAVLADLDDDERKLLQYLLDRGGWARLHAVTRKFGTLEGDGYFWNEEEPCSNLGFLWSRALVMVGRTPLGGRHVKIASIPSELREKLARLLH